MTTHPEASRWRRHGAAIAAGIAAFAVGAAAMLWAWNTIAVDLFAAPAIGFRHALAAEAAIVVAGALFANAARLASRRRDRPGAAR